MTAGEDGKRVGSYSSNFAEWFDNPLVFSNQPYKKTSYGISRYNHYSSSRFLKHMFCFISSTMNAVSAAVHAVLAWRLDRGFSLMFVVERGGEVQAHWLFCKRPEPDAIGPFVQLCEVGEGRTKNAVKISIFRLPGPIDVSLNFFSSFCLDKLTLQCHHLNTLLYTWHTPCEQFIHSTSCRCCGSCIQPAAMPPAKGRHNSTGVSPLWQTLGSQGQFYAHLNLCLSR